MFRNFFASRWGIIGVGAGIGILAAVLQKLGNPGNMGICVACFERDIAGALGLHRAGVVQYIRPEVIGFVLGSLVAAYSFKEFRPRAGSAPMVRFVLGVFAMIGALVFLGCPWRAALRLAGGDGNAVVGLLGLTGGIWIGTLFLKNGYNLGRSQATHTAAGWMLPLMMAGFLVLMLVWPAVAGQNKSGALFYSLKGPGAMHAALPVSLAAGLVDRLCSPAQPVLHHGGIAGSDIVSPDASDDRLGCIGGFCFCNQHPGRPIQPRFCRTACVPYHACMEFCRYAAGRTGLCPGRRMSLAASCFMAGEGDGDAADLCLRHDHRRGFCPQFRPGQLAQGPRPPRHRRLVP